MQCEWYTPQFIIDLAREVLGVINVDPASNLIVQKWIYAHKRKEINSNVLTGGAELVELKTIVDEWSDSKEAYREARKEFIGILNMSDNRFQNEIVKSQVGSLQY
jgi:hypothetical protein